MLNAVDLEQDFVQMLFVTGPSTTLRRREAYCLPNFLHQRLTLSELTNTPRAAIASSTSLSVTSANDLST